MALTSRFATATLKPGTVVRRPTAPKASIGAAALPAALGPQSVAAPAATPQVADVAVSPSVVPPDASYEASVAGLTQQRDQTLTALQQQRQQALLQYGYTQDATGSLAFDATNPFSQAALLKRNYDQAQSGNVNSYAARGQLYSGALQNAQNETGFQNQRQNDTLQKGLLAFLAKNTGDAASAGTNYDLGVGQAQGQALQNAQNNSLYQAQLNALQAPAGVSTAAQGAVGDPVVQTIPWKSSKGVPGVLHIHASGARIFVAS